MIESVGGNRGWIRWLLVWVLYGLKRPQMWVGCDWDKNRNEDWTYRLWPVERSIDQSVAGGKKWERFNYRELFFLSFEYNSRNQERKPIMQNKHYIHFSALSFSWVQV